MRTPCGKAPGVPARGTRRWWVAARAMVACMVLTLSRAGSLAAQERAVLQLDPHDAFGGALPPDRGAAGLRQRLLELRTTASVMHVTAHPDDEQSGLLTWFSRGTGARTSLLTLNRGEAGANAVGSELFDALGLLRTEELLLAGRYYGLDDQYFTSATDYGYSKTMVEAARSWDTTTVLRDMVRVIRRDQPLVVTGRWFGGDRDGHGHHQLAGVLTPLAVTAAADSARFPELRAEGLRPWRVLRLFRSNVRATERADVVVDAGRWDPWLGESYASMGSDGLSRQRSQTSGRRDPASGRSPQRLQQLFGPSIADSTDPLSGIDTSLPGVVAMSGERVPGHVLALLRAADVASRRALLGMDPARPWAVVPRLVEGLRAIRDARDRVPTTSRTHHVLDIKVQQFERALLAAVGAQVTALAGGGAGDGHPGVPGDTVPVVVVVSQESPLPVTVEWADVIRPIAWGAGAGVRPAAGLTRGVAWRETFSVPIPATATPTRPHFARGSIAENHYSWDDASVGDTPRPAAPLRARVTLRVGGELVGLERVVRFRQSREPEGTAYPRFVILPPVSLRIAPSVRVVTDTGAVTLQVAVEVTGQAAIAVDAMVGLVNVGGAPGGATERVRVARGERKAVTFAVTLPRGADSLVVSAMARVGAREWGDEVTVIAHRELEPAYLYATPLARIRRVPVAIERGLKVAYIMGVGDLVPDAIAQLGATVTLLDAAAVASGDFARYDAVAIGTRAYAVCPELPAATAALTAYANGGGNVVVLYQTQEFKPETMAPFRAALPGNAEEVTEQDSPVRLISPSHPMLTMPNRITSADFDGWIEQRGSKFLTQLAPEYTSLVEVHDTGQAPQEGSWVTARVGKGQWSYVALALHRQVPYAVPGAFRILANILSRPQAR